MAEKSSEVWEVSLAFLQDHRKIATVGAHCNGCGYKRRWPVEESRWHIVEGYLYRFPSQRLMHTATQIKAAAT